jgi:hypothetical protein
MFRFILPVILIGIAIAGFFILTNPLYQDISLKRDQIASYNEALGNSKALESERDKLTQKYNEINPEDLSKLKKLLPDNVDNIRLILEIEKIASPYGMALKDVKYNTTDTAVTPTNPQTAQTNTGETKKDYGVWNLEFSTQGTYNNFLNLIKDLENNLRVVDISSIEFSSSLTPGLNPSLAQAYKYDFKIKTYWLKN